MKKLAISFLLIFTIIAIAGFVFASNWYNSSIYTKVIVDEAKQFEIFEGESFNQVLTRLESEQLINSKLAIQIYMQLENINPAIKTGVYILKGEYDIKDLISTFEKGVQKASKFVTIKEGLMTEKIGQILNENLAGFTKFNLDEFNKIALEPDSVQFSSKIKEFLNTHKPAGKPLRGFIFPDTYRFDEGMTTQEIVEMIIDNFIKRFEENKLQDLIGKNPLIPNLYSALTLGSIVEKEASGKDDKKSISAVFVNRLRVGMTLGSDATINFITGKSDVAALLFDTNIQNEYNTYQKQGLPPTPINNPSMASIIASFSPNSHEFYYFFHDDFGNTYYSKTLYEHNSQVCRIRGC